MAEFEQESTNAGHRQRLRQRFLRSGSYALADYELIELILTLAIPRSDVKQPAKRLIQSFGNLRGILDASVEDLRKVNGIGEVTPVALKIIRSAATLYLQQSAESEDSLFDSQRLAEFWRMRIGNLPNEVFQVAYLNSGYRLLRDRVEELEQGTIDRAAVYPRRVIESALRRHAAAIVLAHNHPALMLALNAGMRNGEIRHLRWNQVDLKKQFLTVGKSKTEAGEGRTIPLNAALLEALRHHAEWYTLRFGKIEPEWYLFPFGRANHLDPTRPITTIKTAWRNAKERAGVTGRLHDSRHTLITELAESGAGDQTIMDIAGHVSRQMLKHHSHIRMQAKREALEAVSKKQQAAEN